MVMKQTHVVRLLAGLLSTVAAMAALFYAFMFWNPFQIYHVNLLKWIPILICALSLGAAGYVNRETPLLLLPVLFLPYAVFDLFKFFYLPFVLVLFVVGSLTLAVTRPELSRSTKVLATTAIVTIFAFFLFSQPLRIETTTSNPAAEGDLSVVRTIWDFTEQERRALPEHVLATPNGHDFPLRNLRGKTHLVTIWATWCGPCLAEKPDLERLKAEMADEESVGFLDLSIDEDKSAWKTYLDENTPLGQQVVAHSPDETRRALNIGALPLHFIVDPDGQYRTFSSLKQAETALREVDG